MSTASFLERAWYTSSYTNQGQNTCLEVNHSPAGHVGVRDSKLGTASPVLAIPAPQWARALTAVQDGTLNTRPPTRSTLLLPSSTGELLGATRAAPPVELGALRAVAEVRAGTQSR
ncbi:MAG: DUF397 domain-containing protein [Pseudonocardiales bacterium]|nr:DUF397 domain-containing protein [Pseudonocardiales bacterium]MBV9032350.1 DUF397 domain-containing protein [Pseudonocardiales bacterium]MBW0010837.1 DUF397 domain-containing protein [Pseudonocardiales bacterium]